MPTLDEYLGGIFASLTQARLSADVQAARVAEQYSRHELLRHFAVPHLRFSQIELTIPVAIETVQPGSRSGISEEAREAVRKPLLAGVAKMLRIGRLPKATVEAVTPAIDAALDRLAERGVARPREDSLAEFGEELACDVRRALEKTEASRRQRFDSAAFAQIAREEAAKHAGSIVPAASLGDLEVIAESHRLREQRPSDLLVIKMSINEEGMEWQQMEMSDGRTERKLLPE